MEETKNTTEQTTQTQETTDSKVEETTKVKGGRKE